MRNALQRTAGRAEREAARPALAPKPPRPRLHTWQRSKPVVRLDAWTPGEDDTVVRRILAGDTVYAIARDLGRTRGAIEARALIHRNCSRLPSRADMSWSLDAESELLALRAAGLSDDEVARRLGRSEKAIWARLGRLRRQGVAVATARRDHRWRPETVATVAEMAERGSTPAEIVAATGRSLLAVRNKLRDLAQEGRLPAPGGEGDEADDAHETGGVRHPTPGADPLLVALMAAHGRH